MFRRGPHRETSPDRGFDFTAHMRLLCQDVAARLPELNHIAMDHVALRVCQARKAVAHGIQASLTPLRFAGGERTARRGKRWWTIPPMFDSSGQEMLYLLSFYLPRFCNQSPPQKLATVIHELWHIGPRFDGDIRRLPGRCYAHGSREAEFHREMDKAAQRWLALSPPRELYDFLSHDFRQLALRSGPVFGTKMRTPRLVPAAAPHDA